MHIYVSGIGGSGVGPLAEIAHQVGYRVSGSDKQHSRNIEHLRALGIDIHIGQTVGQIAAVHEAQPIDWLVYSSAVAFEGAGAPELDFASAHGIRVSKRDQLLNEILAQLHLNLIAVAGTHGKTTTVAMMVYLLRQLGVPVSYILSAETNFAKMAEYDPKSQYFVYEADEFDRNFLHFSPFVSLISGIGYDHQEVFPTIADYHTAFCDYVAKSRQTFVWDEDAAKLGLGASDTVHVVGDGASAIHLPGRFNRRDGWLVATAASSITGQPVAALAEILSQFPGLGERMEPIAPNLYSNYAHTPEKIMAGINVALEMKKPEQRLVIVYEPLTNRRQHFLLDSYGHVFDGASQIYWLPSRLAREDPSLPVLTPAQLIDHLDDDTRAVACPAAMGDALKRTIDRHLEAGDMVVAMVAGGGEDGLDHWLRTTLGAGALA